MRRHLLSPLTLPATLGVAAAPQAAAFDDGDRVPQSGLIAEEVAEVAPDLVVRGPDDQPETVRYCFLPPLLVAETQRLERERAQQDARQAAQAAETRDTARHRQRVEVVGTPAALIG